MDTLSGCCDRIFGGTSEDILCFWCCATIHWCVGCSTDRPSVLGSQRLANFFSTLNVYIYHITQARGITIYRRTSDRSQSEISFRSTNSNRRAFLKKLKLLVRWPSSFWGFVIWKTNLNELRLATKLWISMGFAIGDLYRAINDGWSHHVLYLVSNSGSVYVYLKTSAQRSCYGENIRVWVAHKKNTAPKVDTTPKIIQSISSALICPDPDNNLLTSLDTCGEEKWRMKNLRPLYNASLYLKL